MITGGIPMSNISKICGMIFFSLTALSGCSFGTVKAPEAVRIEPQYTEEELAAMIEKALAK